MSKIARRISQQCISKGDRDGAAGREAVETICEIDGV